MSALLDPARVLEAPDAALSREDAAALLGDIDRWCERTGTPGNILGQMALDFGGYVGLLRRRGTARSRTAGLVRCFLARWPDGVPLDERDRARRAAWELLFQSRSPSLKRQHRPIGARAASSGRASGVPVAEQVRAEAEEAGRRRAAARAQGTVTRSTFAMLDPSAPPMVTAVDRDPCPRCGVRGDIGCAHRPLAPP